MRTIPTGGRKFLSGWGSALTPCRPVPAENLEFLARDSMLSALYAIARPSVCPSHWWISRKRLKLGSCNVHRTVAPSLSFLQYKFHPEIITESPERGRQTRVGNLTVAACAQFNTWRLHSSFARRRCHRATWCLHVGPIPLLILLNSLDLRRCNIILQYTRKHYLFCGCVLFRFCFKLDFLRLHGHRFKTRQISHRPTN